MVFRELEVGDVFRTSNRATCEFIKISDAIDDIRIDQQKPNSLNLSNKHYCVVGNKAAVFKIKGVKDFEPDENSIFDWER